MVKEIVANRKILATISIVIGGIGLIGIVMAGYSALPILAWASLSVFFVGLLGILIVRISIEKAGIEHLWK